MIMGERVPSRTLYVFLLDSSIWGSFPKFGQVSLPSPDSAAPLDVMSNFRWIVFFWLKRNDSSRDVGKKKETQQKKNDTIRLSNGRTFYIGLFNIHGKNIIYISDPDLQSFRHRVVERILLNPWILGVNTEDSIFCQEFSDPLVEKLPWWKSLGSKKKTTKIFAAYHAICLLKSRNNC